MTSSERAQRTSESRWQAGNQAYLNTEMYRLRLLLRRRVLWLRRLWRSDPLEEYRGMLISETQADWLLAGEDHQAEARFYLEDPTAAQIGHTIDELEKELERQVQAL